MLKNKHKKGKHLDLSKADKVYQLRPQEWIVDKSIQLLHKKGEKKDASKNTR